MSNSLMNKNTWSGTTEAYIALFDPNANIPIGEMLKYDARNLVGASTSSVERIIHSKLMVIKKLETEISNNIFLPINCNVGNPYISNSGQFNQGDIAEAYQNSLWEFSLTDGTIIGIQQSYINIAAVYTYLQTIVPNDGTYYTQTVYATIYDEINNSIEPIEKIYGINTFSHVLNGGRKQKHNYINNNSNVHWSELNNWIEDLYIKTGIDSAHTYNIGDEKILKIPNNYKKSFSGYNSEVANNFTISNTKYVFDMNTGTISNNHSGYYMQDFNMSKYCFRSIETENKWYWYDWDDLFFINGHLLNKEYSCVSVNVFRHIANNNLVTVMIKPVNIDTVYIDYFDKTKYDLYRIENGIDQYHKYTKIDMTNVEQHKPVNITRLYPSNYYIDNLETKRNGKFGVVTDFNYRFILKDINLNQFSPISKMKIDWYSGGHKRNNLVYCRVRK